MSPIRAHFDGTVFVPDEPVTIPLGTAAHVLLVPIGQPIELTSGRKPLKELAELLASLPDDGSDSPEDASMNIDHYVRPSQTQ